MATKVEENCAEKHGLRRVCSHFGSRATCFFYQGASAGLPRQGMHRVALGVCLSLPPAAAVERRTIFDVKSPVLQDDREAFSFFRDQYRCFADIILPLVKAELFAVMPRSDMTGGILRQNRYPGGGNCGEYTDQPRCPNYAFMLHRESSSFFA